jgi:hypothetical protein
MSEIDMMKLDVASELAVLLMETDSELTMEQALETVLNSDTYQRLQKDSAQLYHQSPRYVFAFLESELRTGKVE